MKRSLLLLSMFLFFSVVWSQEENDPSKYTIALQPASSISVLEDDAYYTWGASPIKGDDGLYHLFYSRWKKEYGFLAWVTHSEVAHATSKNPLGPYEFQDLALPARGKEYWDGLNTHNPTIHFFEGKYYLYYTGNTGNGVNMKTDLNATHRNNQRLGVAVSVTPFGPWQRFDQPLIDVSAHENAHDALMMANPSITKMQDGKYLLVYKAVAKQLPGIWGGPVVHLCATSDSPIGPFEKKTTPIFTAKESSFPAEDPYIWMQDGTYYAIVKDMKGSFTPAGRSLVLFYSTNGFDWNPTENPLISVPEIRWEDGTLSKMEHLERPQLLIEDGKPIALFLAADDMVDYSQSGHSFNVHIPLK
ncbi:MAG: glycoside hydrolase family protein [Phocaeicola sp.]